MTGTNLALRVQFIASAHAEPAPLDFRAVWQHSKHLRIRARIHGTVTGATGHTVFSVFIRIIMQSSLSIVQHQPFN
jgi:hypothetical protein